ncbi:uncharacterized protein EDB91DRAFT_1076576 [Suillus paluster]|uniref:uncharacterized protein n=1 Tax=Suillus paluster TaxID=48578 RepID=UPI001B86B31C|nr:uncharacterized protein EDB91DRAFT_1076576 [Suillus paluster]KAG1756590.1 hypothetical protein EDB91DRAFT_1076576 [Suillus paluster]
MSGFSFAALATDSNEDERIRHEFDAIHEWLVGTAKSVPDDKDELLEEEDWMRLWVDLTTRLEACITVGRGKGIVLGLSADEVIAGDAGQSMYEHFCGQEEVSDGGERPGYTWGFSGNLIEVTTSSRSAACREKANGSRASAVSASVGGSIRRTVSSPTLDSAAKDASSDGESEVAADLPPRHIRPRPTRQTNKGKGHAINVDEYEDEKSKMRMENEELCHGLRKVQGKLLKMYELAYELADDLRKMEAKLADRM